MTSATVVGGDVEELASLAAGAVVVSGASGSLRRRSSADLELASWRRLGSAAARRRAERIADDIGAELVEARPRQYAGRPGRIARYRRDRTLYALVPGGKVMLGYDSAWFTPTPDQAADLDGAHHVAVLRHRQQRYGAELVTLTATTSSCWWPIRLGIRPR